LTGTDRNHPVHPVDWWDQEALQAALTARHFGRLFRAYRQAHDPEIRQATLGR